ncbi:MAG: aminoacyl-tRNA hydrolase [Clostridia bacterium]|nr:aminoacyl-tRNA hydrolase [Clostridia bacterium]
MFLQKPEFIIAGLGNPGKEYELSRHNTGFLCMDEICSEYSARCDRVKFEALTGKCVISGHSCLLMKPQTFMNSSGVAISQAADFYKIPPENVIVIFDDISLPEGVVRIRQKGSAGGHNGVKSVIQWLCSEDFPRIKIGVGERADPDSDLIGHVLGRFSKQGLEKEKDAFSRAVKAVALMVDGQTELAMSRYNG